MKKNIPFHFFCLLIFSTCSGLPAKPPASFADTSGTSFFSSFSSNGGLVFFGAAGKRSNPNETLQLALEDAAQRVAVFFNVTGEYAVENNIGSGAFDYTYNTYTALHYDKEGSKQYVDVLQYDADTDSIEIENTLIVRTSYPSALSVPVKYHPSYSNADHKPDWVDNPVLKIEGYEVGVGYSARYSSLADTFNNSYYNAIFAIIRNINTASRNSETFYQNTGGLFGYKTSSDNVTYSYGTLTGCYALDIWIDPKIKTVWTLAIAEKAK